MPFFRCRSVMIDYQSAAKKRQKIISSPQPSSWSCTNTPTKPVRPPMTNISKSSHYLILFSPFKWYFRQGKAFDWLRGLIFGSEEFLFWVHILDLDPDFFFWGEVFFFGPDFMFWSRLSFWTGFSFGCRLSFWTGFVNPTFILHFHVFGPYFIFWCTLYFGFRF